MGEVHSLEGILATPNEELEKIEGFGKTAMRVIEVIRSEYLRAGYQGAIGSGKNLKDAIIREKNNNYQALCWQMYRKVIFDTEGDSELPDDYMQTFQDVTETLPEKEREVFRLRSGVNEHGIKFGHKEIGEKLGITTEESATLYKNALKDMRHFIRFRWMELGSEKFALEEKEKTAKRMNGYNLIQTCRAKKLKKTKRIIEDRRKQGKIPAECEDEIQKLYAFISAPTPIDGLSRLHAKARKVLQQLDCETVDDVLLLDKDAFLRAGDLSYRTMREIEGICGEAIEAVENELRQITGTEDGAYHIVPIDLLPISARNKTLLKNKDFATLEDILLKTEEMLYTIPLVGQTIIDEAMTACATYIKANPWADIPERVLDLENAVIYPEDGSAPHKKTGPMGFDAKNPGIQKACKLLYHDVFGPQTDYALPQNYVATTDRVLCTMLPTKDKDILVRRYGLDKDGKQMALSDIAELYGVNEDRVKILIMTAIRALRQPERERALLEGDEAING